jgi:hypothetical protein
MDAYKDDIIDDLTTTAVDVTGNKIYNHKHLQQSPPFLTERTMFRGSESSISTNRDLDVTSAGSIERDQQGQPINSIIIIEFSSKYNK